MIGPIQSKGKWGFLSPSGDWEIEPEFEMLGEFREGLAGFVAHGKLGFIDQTGNVIIEPRFSLKKHFFTVWGFRDGLAPIHSDETSYYIDQSGNIVLTLPSRGMGWHFVDGRAIFLEYSQSRYRVIDANGTILSTLPVYEVPCLTDWPRTWDCFSCLFTNNPWTAGALNWQGKVLFEPKYAGLGEFVGGVAPFKVNDESEYYGLVALDGEVLLEPTLFGIGDFFEGLAPAALAKRRCGFINIKGEWMIEPKYKQVTTFHDGLACVTVDDGSRYGKKGFINKEGEMVIEPRFHRESSFHDGYAEVEFEGKRAVIDKSGRAIWVADLD